MADDPIPELKRHAAEVLVRVAACWDQNQAAVMLRTDQPRISNLRHGRLERMSLERLIRWLVRARCEVELRITEHPRFSANRRA